MPWPRSRLWRPGEAITVTLDGRPGMYLLRGVMRDGDPESEYATILLEPVGTMATQTDEPGSGPPG